MAKYLEEAMEIMQKIKANRKLAKSGGNNSPWPGYNGGNQFVCERCGTHFDTSAGFAKHQAIGCEL